MANDASVLQAQAFAAQAQAQAAQANAAAQLAQAKAQAAYSEQKKQDSVAKAKAVESYKKSTVSSSSSLKKSGVNKTIAKKAYNNVKNDLQELEKYMNKLVADVENMNKNYWYGDNIANKWYAKMKGHYSENKDMNLVSFYTNVSKFQESLETVFKKAGLNKISF